MAIIQIEEELFHDMLGRISFLRKQYARLYERLRNRDIGEWLTIEQVCAILNVSDTKVRSLKRSGRLGFIKCGKTLRFDAGDVYAILERVERNAYG